MHISRIEREQIGVLLIDVQPVFWDYAFPDDDDRKEPVMVRLEHLLMLAGWLELPLITTFEIPVSENGELPERLEAVFPSNGQRFTKNYFDCTSEKDIREAIEGLPVRQFVVAGAETDVCIMQSVLGLLQMGYQVFLLEDCLFTSESQPGPALRRMVQAGAQPCTLKTMAYELVKCVDNVPWYPEGWLERDQPDIKLFPKKFIPPEEWPPWEPKA